MSQDKEPQKFFFHEEIQCCRGVARNLKSPLKTSLSR